MQELKELLIHLMVQWEVAEMLLGSTLVAQTGFVSVVHYIGYETCEDLPVGYSAVPD